MSFSTSIATLSTYLLVVVWKYMYIHTYIQTDRQTDNRQTDRNADTCRTILRHCNTLKVIIIIWLTFSSFCLSTATRRLSSYDPDKMVKLSLSARVQSVSLELSSLTSSVLLASSSGKPGKQLAAFHCFWVCCVCVGVTATMRMNPSKLSLRAG